MTKRPDDLRCHYALGRFFLNQSRIELSERHARACESDVENGAVEILLGRCLWEQGDVASARETLLRVTEWSETDLRSSFQRVGEPLVGRPDAAVLGALEAAEGNHDAALHWLEVAYEAAPDDLDVRYARALALRETGETEAANRELAFVAEAREKLTEVDRLVDELDPYAPEVDKRLRIAELYREFGLNSSAEYWFRSILGHEPGHRRAHEALADYYQSLPGERSQALALSHRRAARSVDASPIPAASKASE